MAPTASPTLSPHSSNPLSNAAAKRPHEGAAKIVPSRPANQPSEPVSQLQRSQSLRRVIVPLRYQLVERRDPSSFVNDDPVFDTPGAAIILGVKADTLKKWRTREQGPDYYQYEGDGPVRYPLSALLEYKAKFLVVTTKKRKEKK